MEWPGTRHRMEDRTRARLREHRRIQISPECTTCLDPDGQLIREAELPTSVVNLMTGGREAGAAIAEHLGIDKVMVFRPEPLRLLPAPSSPAR